MMVMHAKLCMLNHVKLCQNTILSKGLKRKIRDWLSVAISKQSGNCITTDTIKQR